MLVGCQSSIDAIWSNRGICLGAVDLLSGPDRDDVVCWESFRVETVESVVDFLEVEGQVCCCCSQGGAWQT